MKLHKTFNNNLKLRNDRYRRCTVQNFRDIVRMNKAQNEQHLKDAKNNKKILLYSSKLNKENNNIADAL